MNTAVEEQKRTARVSGVSFSPDVWDYLNEEVERQGHRNRSLVIEKALKVYQRVQEIKATGVTVIVLEGDEIA